MNEEYKNEEKFSGPNEETRDEDLLFLVKKIREQLLFLEKKVDILINREQGERRPRMDKQGGFKHRGPSPSQYYKKPSHGFKSGSHEYHGQEGNFEKGHYYHKRRDEEGRRRRH